MAEQKKTVDITTGVGTLSFPHVFKETVSKKDDGTPEYNIQIIIPKSQREDIRDLMRAIKEVGMAKWGDKWKGVRSPLRDGDKEKDDLTDDGTTKGEKYPERLGCYFLNARSSKPVGVFDRTRTPITDPDAVYGGCRGKVAITFYPYNQSGNQGIGAGLNGVQKIGDGEAFGGGRPAPESMFDMLDEDDDLDLDDEPDEKPAKAKKAKAKAAPEPAKKSKAKGKKSKAKADEDDDFADLDDDI